MASYNEPPRFNAELCYNSDCMFPNAGRFAELARSSVDRRSIPSLILLINYRTGSFMI